MSEVKQKKCQKNTNNFQRQTGYNLRGKDITTYARTRFNVCVSFIG